MDHASRSGRRYAARIVSGDTWPRPNHSTAIAEPFCRPCHPETDTHAKEHDGTSCYLRVGGLPVHDADAGQKQKGDRNDRDHRTVEAVEDDCRRPSDEKGERNGEQLLLLAVIGPASFSD